MPLSVLQLLLKLLLLVNTAYGQNITDAGQNHLLSENNGGDIKGNPLDENLFDDRTLTQGIIRPTPGLINYPYLEPSGTVESIKPEKPVALPPASSPIIVQPPPSPTQSVEVAPTCGRKGNCYQWFDAEWEMILNGYQRCSSSDKRRARRYCCVH